MARKPLRGTVAANVGLHGTGALNIDGTRIRIGNGERVVGGDFSSNRPGDAVQIAPGGYDGAYTVRDEASVGRWPANVILTDPIFDGGIEGVIGGGETTSGLVRAGSAIAHDDGDRATYGDFGGMIRTADTYGDSGTYSRFFLIPRRYNETCLNCGLASDAVERFYLPNPSAGSAPDPVPTAALSAAITATDSPTTSAIALASLSDDAANTPSTRRSKRRAISPASGPASSSAKYPDASAPAIDTTTITGSRWMCGTCAEATTSASTSASNGTPAEQGSYPRFLLIPKADRGEREPVAGSLPSRIARSTVERHTGNPSAKSGERIDLPRQNVHPTVKPVDLMRHLVRLVTPSGGIVLDPFLGSGTTGIACEMEGFDWIGIEREAEYVAIAEARLVGVQRGFGWPA